jgi:uncharacterized protein YjdB
MTLAKGTSLQMFAIVQTEDAANYGVVWSMTTLEGSDVARLNSSTGLLETRNTGKVKITATAGGKSASCVVTVVSPVTKMTVSPKAITYEPTAIGQKFNSPFYVTIEPDDAEKGVTWTSNNTAVVKVNGTTGQLTITGPGKATITATAADGSGISGTCTVTVKEPVKVIGVLRGDPVVVFMGDAAVDFSYKVRPPEATNNDVTLSVADPSIAKVALKDGAIAVKGLKIGMTDATLKSVSGPKQVTFSVVVINKLTPYFVYVIENCPSYDKPKVEFNSFMRNERLQVLGEIDDYHYVSTDTGYRFIKKADLAAHTSSNPIQEFIVTVPSIYTSVVGEYGGNQGEMQFAPNDYVEIIKKWFPTWKKDAFDSYTPKVVYDPYYGTNYLTLTVHTEDEIQLYLERISDTGCGYTAFANTVFNHFYGNAAGFQNTFGFPMKDSKGNFNTGVWIVDFYSYVLMKRIGSDMPTVDNGQDDNYIRGEGKGYSTADNSGYFKAYMQEHGINVDVIKLDSSNITTANFVSVAKSGEIILEADEYTLYNEDGSNFNMPLPETYHAMVITGITSDGYFIVSSGGKKLYIKETELKTLSYYFFIQVVYK